MLSTKLLWWNCREQLRDSDSICHLYSSWLKHAETNLHNKNPPVLPYELQRVVDISEALAAIRMPEVLFVDQGLEKEIRGDRKWCDVIAQFSKVNKADLPPLKLTWNLKITWLKTKIIFHPPPFLGSMLVFRGCIRTEVEESLFFRGCWLLDSWLCRCRWRENHQLVLVVNNWVIICAIGSHYFHIIGDGHQPNSRGLYTHL